MISAFQKCSKFENRTNFGKTPYPKGNVVNYKYSLSDMVLENLKWATLEIPHILSHGLNLINHMKLYINRPNTKRGKEEEDRKKKEQESTEVIRGLKK